MTLRAAGLVLATAVVVLLLALRERQPSAADRDPGSSRAAAAAAPTLTPVPWTVPSRNVFEYVESAPRATPPLAPRAPERLPSLAPPPPPEIKVTGLLRRGAAVKAALTRDGQAAFVGVGEAAYGATVVAIDDDAGVRLRLADGTEVTLPLPD